MARTSRSEIINSAQATPIIPNGKLRRIQTTQYREVFSGPLPPPDALIKYEEACKGAANRIIAMAEKQAKHRQGMEAKVIGSNVENEKIGMWLAFTLTVLIMGAGIYLIMNNKSVLGFIALFGPGLFQASNYVYNKYSERKHANARKQEKKQDNAAQESSN